MEIEEIKSMAPELGFVNLGKPLYELCEWIFGRPPYICAMFNQEDLDPDNTLDDVFDNKCLIQDIKYHTHAVGFIDEWPTHAYTQSNQLHIKPIGYMPKKRLYDWYDAIFNNFFGFDASEIRDNVCVYDRANDLLIDITFNSPDHIYMEFYFTEKYNI